MASKLTKLSFNEIGGKTTTVIDGGKQKDMDEIVFYNEHPTKGLTIEFVPTDSFVDGSVVVPKIEMLGLGEKKLHINKGNPPGQVVRVKVTATLAGCTPEDPIVIIEK